ncbi:hypothetical protein DFH11DRAFT_1582684, partial [Phellopilus nigrolimitatus]
MSMMFGRPRSVLISFSIASIVAARNGSQGSLEGAAQKKRREHVCLLPPARKVARSRVTTPCSARSEGSLKSSRLPSARTRMVARVSREGQWKRTSR